MKKGIQDKEGRAAKERNRRKRERGEREETRERIRNMLDRVT